MKVEDLVDSIANLEQDNKDKLMVFVSPYYSTSSLYSNNSLLDSSSTVEYTTINKNKRLSSYTASSSYSDFISIYSSLSVAADLLTANITSNSRYLTLFEKLKKEAGMFSGTLCLDESIITAKFDANQINELIKCSVSEDMYESGRIQFVKNVVKQLNRYLDDNNLFYFYNVSDIKTNYSDDDSLTDSLYSKLTTENVYNYFDKNYEQQSVTVDEKLLPGALHQASIYTDNNYWNDRGSYFNSPYNSRLFAVKQIYGDALKFHETIVDSSYSFPVTKYPYLGSPTDPNVYHANVDLSGDFTASFYSNWQASDYISGSYTQQINGYQPINQEYTKLNNTNIHVVVTSSLLQNQLSKIDEEMPFYSKVSFGIPKQEIDIPAYLEMHETTIRTIQAGIVNNLFVNGTIIDEQKLLLKSDTDSTSYTDPTININLLKFFNDYFNITGESNPLCEDGVSSEYIRKLLPIGEATGLSDELFASLGFGARGDGGLNIYNENRLPIPVSEQDDNFNSLFNQSTIFDSHLADSKTFLDFFAPINEVTKKLYLFTKIEKYSVDESGNETHVQNFYFDLRNYILDNRTDDITYYFYDNQVHTNKRYVYKQSQIFVVPALAYGYSSIDAYNYGSDLYLQAAVHSVPILKLIELPTKTQSDIVVLEAPPCKPSVQFYPLLDEKNKLLIKIKPAKSDETAEPISITDEDTSLFDRVMESQNSTGSVFFTYLPELSGIEKYEIFRIETYPSSYQSFSDNLLSYISDVASTTKLFYDRIEANKPYFYCVRAKNYRGIPSNPTNVFKVTLIEDGEFYTLEQEEITNLNQEDIYTRTVIKDAKRFLYIKPAQTQILSTSEITGNAEDMVTDFPLSSADTQVWGKKFKIRIRSKSTGKTIDLNIKFNKNNSGEYKPE